MNHFARLVQTRIFKRNCLNCVYLCQVRHDNPKAKISWGDYLRKEIGPNQVQEEANCYTEQWEAGFGLLEDDTLAEMMYRNNSDAHNWTVKVVGGSGLELKQYCCQYFSPYDASNSMPLDRIWQEQEKAPQRRESWITRIISVTALVVSALAVWRSW